MYVTMGAQGGGVLKKQSVWARLFGKRQPTVVVLHGGAMPEMQAPLSALDEEVRLMLGNNDPLKVRMPPGNFPSFRAAYARGELVARAIDRSTEPPTIIFETPK